MKIAICIPSYKRPKVESLDLFPHSRVYVAEREYDAYISANPDGADIVAMPDNVQGNIARVRNYILDTEFANGADCVAIMDDDMDYIGRFVSEDSRFGVYGYRKVLLSEEQLVDFIVKGALLCDEWGFKHFGVNCVCDPKAYRQHTPFNTTKYIGSPFSCHLNNPIRYDESIPLKEDYDITLQHQLRYGGALRFNMFFYHCKQSEQDGGCADMRSLDMEREQFALLQKKWGTAIVKKDCGSKKEFDYNPIIKSPLKGV